jgi:hypothetical protein
MASRAPRPRRLLLPIVFAAILVGEVTGLAIARSAGHPAGLGAGADGASVAADAARTAVDVERGGPSRSTASDAARDPVSPVAAAARVTPSGANLRPPPPDLVAAARSTTASPAAPPAPAVYRGSNHVWIPALGINRSVQSFPCSRSRAPDAGVYRWGCAGRNNVYLLSHAWSTFKPLHDAYVRGRLRKGMAVWYADGGGTVHRYSVIWWRVTAPTTAASWAWAAQSRPSMTLQTCVGANSQYRLMVRLVQVG